MQDDDFEWVDDKAAANLAKHKVSFEQARLAFDDPFGIIRDDDRVDYGEDRYTLTAVANQRLLVVAYTIRGGRIRIIMARYPQSFEERHAAAMSDPDGKPIREEDLPSMPIVPRVRLVRFRLKLSQEEFAEAYQIPLGTLRDWEQRRKQPDAAARAYLRVIALEPEMVRKALAKVARPRQAEKV